MAGELNITTVLAVNPPWSPHHLFRGVWLRTAILDSKPFSFSHIWLDWPLHEQPRAIFIRNQQQFPAQCRGSENNSWCINEFCSILSIKRTELVFLFYGLRMVYKPVHQNGQGNIRILFIGYPSQILLEFPMNQGLCLPVNLHSTTGFAHHHTSRKSIPTSHLERNENQWLKEDKVFICPFLQCAKNCGWYWQHSNEQSRHVPCLRGA